MNIENIFEIIKFVEASRIKEFNLESDGVKIHIVNETPITIEDPPQKQSDINYLKNTNVIKEENIYNVKAPIIGKVNLVNMSDNTSYLSKGSKVKSGDVLCTIEAMKLINEVVSEVNGEVVEILVDEGNIVEYGQTMFKIKVTNN